MAAEKKRILSGMRPTGPLHLGHLHGALGNWVGLQDEYDCNYMVADWHALTSDYKEPEAIVENTRLMVADWLACGIDPERSVLFVQSQILEHAELHLLLSMIIPLPWLERVPTYREQREQLVEKDLGTYGFLGYPLLQTADIIIYRAHAVPVGEDQLPHVELSRDIARRFNNFYGDVFPEPKGLVTESPRVPGTDGRKMSKSYGNAIYLGDTADQVEKKLRPMVTDTRRQRRKDPGDPADCPVFDLHKLFTSEQERAEITEGCKTAGIGCLDCKLILNRGVNEQLEPIREKRAAWLDKPQAIDEILAEGAKAARAAARATMDKVRSAMGISA